MSLVPEANCYTNHVFFQTKLNEMKDDSSNQYSCFNTAQFRNIIFYYTCKFQGFSLIRNEIIDK